MKKKSHIKIPLSLMTLLLLGNCCHPIKTLKVNAATSIQNQPIINEEREFDSLYYQLDSLYELVTEEDILLEEYYGDLELLAQITQAEAGNQSLDGKRLVVDVILNRLDSPKFPNTIGNVIFQSYQFSPVEDGQFEESGFHISEECFLAVDMEVTQERLDSNILYFSNTTDPVNGKYAWKFEDHWFSY